MHAYTGAPYSHVHDSVVCLIFMYSEGLCVDGVTRTCPSEVTAPSGPFLSFFSLLRVLPSPIESFSLIDHSLPLFFLFPRANCHVPQRPSLPDRCSLIRYVQLQVSAQASSAVTSIRQHSRHACNDLDSSQRVLHYVSVVVVFFVQITYRMRIQKHGQSQTKQSLTNREFSFLHILPSLGFPHVCGSN